MIGTAQDLRRLEDQLEKVLVVAASEDDEKARKEVEVVVAELELEITEFEVQGP